jgi:hypothetical protein
MNKRQAVLTVVALLVLAAMAAGQAQEQYLDVYYAQVKPEKRAEFDAITKKMVAANRPNGDTWITLDTVYGHGDRVTFISMRGSYGEIEKGMDAFSGSMEKALGKAGTDKLFQDFSQCVISTRTEIRRRRWDLSSNVPADPAAVSKLLGGARWLRTVAVHVKPGQTAVFEALLKDVKAAREKATPPQTSLVSQAVAGQEGTVFYVTTLQSSMSGFDSVPTAMQLLGEEGYAKYLKANADTVESAETVISRFVPELSNAPADVVAAAPDYWTPKPVVAAKAKTKGAVVKAAETGKEKTQ